MNELKRKALEKQILDVLKSMDDSELSGIWNEYCDRCNMYDDRIESMDLLPELFNRDDIFNILNRAYFGSDQFNKESSFNPTRDFFTFNGYGNLVSLECIGWNEYANDFMYDGLDIDALVDFIIDNNDSLYNDDIQTILDDAEYETA